MISPSIEQQKSFIVFYFRNGGLDTTSMEVELQKASPAEIKKTVIGLVPTFYEMGWNDEKINSELEKVNLPGIAYFKSLNKKYVKKILSKGVLKHASDVFLVKESLDNDLLDPSDAEIAKKLLVKWDV